MVFSSITFIYYFLPIVLFLYFIVFKKKKNFILLISSLLFYFFGEPKYIFILIFYCVINFFGAKFIYKYKEYKKIILFLTLFIDLGLLLYFKYTNFIISNINSIFNLSLSYLYLIMPIGISFFTFQSIGYVIDVYKGEVKPCYSFINFTMYISLFSQLIAGPIVRYKDINNQLNRRKTSINSFGEGFSRFIIGLAKKVLIANQIGEMIDILFKMNNTSVLAYILITIGFTLQIYFDFSGYSDMAIGLGKIFGFTFLENFNYPLMAISITDFWRRWHISLYNFFKDYVYIPLGGSRVSVYKNVRNILIVWFLTGLWHGAEWNFIIWGLYFGLLLVLEKYLINKFLLKHKLFSRLYTLFFVLISFIIFNISDLNELVLFLRNLFGFSKLSFTTFETIYYFKSYILIIILGIFSSTSLFKNIWLKLKMRYENNIFLNRIELIFIFGLLILVTAYLVDSSFNPFIYFRF